MPKAALGLLAIVGCSSAPGKRVEPPQPVGCAAELDAAIGRAKTELLPLLPIDESFALGRPAREHEARLRPILDGVFGVNPGGALTYRVECHANACKVEVNHTLASAGWRREVPQLAMRMPEAVRGTQFVGDTLYVRTTPIGVEAWLEVDGGDCASREAQLRDYDARLDELRPMSERFVLLPESPIRERIVRAAIHTTGHFEIECHGTICRVEGGMGVDLVRDELKGLFDHFEIEQLFQRTLWAEQRGDEVARGNVIFETVFAELDGPRVAACKRLLREPGELAFELVEEGFAVHAQATGKHGTTPAATCLRELVDEILARQGKLDAPVQLPLRPIRFWVHSAS